MRHLLLWAGISAAILADAQELLLLGGATHETRASGRTFAMGLEYAQGLGENAHATLALVNEGHLEEHHRDGFAAQIWARSNLLDRRLSLALGVGPYSYFDTEQASRGASFANDHGWGVIYSAGLTWYAHERWLVHLRASRIDARSSFDTTMFLVGVGYLLDAPSVRGPRPSAPSLAGMTTNDEVALFLGGTILNSLESEKDNSGAFAAEWRRGLGRHVDWTVGWLHEGANAIIRRNGVTTQAWLVRPFLDDRLVLGVGAGGYFVVNEEKRGAKTDDNDERASAIVTLTASWRLDPRWFARLSWNRVATRYNRDTDVILLGGGYRF